MSKRKLAVLFGGRSGEHDVSLRSATSIINAVNRDKFDIIPVGITSEGSWLAGGDPMKALKEKSIPGETKKAVLVTDPGNPGLILWSEKNKQKVIHEFINLDVVFPVLHGPYGEDGAVQGLLEMAGLPYVGSGVLASALGMDKVAMKDSFIRHGLPVGPYIYFLKNQWDANNKYWINEVYEKLSYPSFVKPANLGSSVGISKVYNAEQLEKGINEAFLYDEKVLIEALIPGREIECSVLGDIEVQASVPGEIIPSNDFYDYYAKYIDDRSELIIPAEFSQDSTDEIKRMAVEVFKAVECSGMARVDFFVNNGTITVNEINTIPGFTNISMYPKLWEASGVTYKELIDNLINLALERFRRRQSLLNSPPV